MSALDAAPRTKDFRRTTLRPRHRAVVRAFAEAMFGAPPGERLDAFVADVDAMVSPASFALRAGLLLGLEALRWVAPLVFLRRFAPFEELTLGEREALLAKMDASRVHAWTVLFAGLKTLFVMIYFEEEGELRSIGYPGDVRKRYLQIATTAEPGAAA